MLITGLKQEFLYYKNSLFSRASFQWFLDIFVNKSSIYKVCRHPTISGKYNFKVKED